ncbi:aldo/keto reductase [Streptomyces sp. B3I8]|uniref:aldo/keto reductase n=1 Tax=Streptomyces sp. B3I8 TaxID=3042303 RepID=UPI0027D7D044|nr:aldo/keto reductase [Streptomyces sp. B3I8]
MKGPRSARLFPRAASRCTGDASESNRPIVEVVREIAGRTGITPGQPALAWVLAQGKEIVTLPGTKRVVHLEENVAAG